jgi:hypothetical protein
MRPWANRQAHAAHKLGRPVADGRNDRPGSDHLAASGQDLRSAGFRHARTQLDLDPLPFKEMPRVFAQRWRQFRQDPIGKFDHEDADLGRVDSGVVFQRLGDQVAHFSGGFDTGKPAANHREGQKLALHLG